MTKERTQAKEFIFDHNYINDIFYAPDLNILERVCGFITTLKT